MRGLLAIEPLYHQIVKGKKTQTRRSGGLEQVNEKPDNWEITGHTRDGDNLFEVDFCDYMDTQRNIHCRPRYKVTEVLYLKEPYGITANGGRFIYKFDHKYNSGVPDNLWKNKLFMPASAAREFVKITGIRCERLLDISDEDCIAEGIDSAGQYRNGELHTLYGYRDYSIIEGHEQHPYDLYGYPPNDAKGSFLSLFKFANKVKEVPNLWVWVYRPTIPV